MPSSKFSRKLASTGSPVPKELEGRGEERSVLGNQEVPSALGSTGLDSFSKSPVPGLRQTAQAHLPPALITHQPEPRRRQGGEWYPLRGALLVATREGGAYRVDTDDSDMVRGWGAERPDMGRRGRASVFLPSIRSHI